MDAKVKEQIQETIDMIDIQDAQFQFLGDRAAYHRESWLEMEHENFFKLLARAYELSLDSYPTDRAEVDNKLAFIQEHWSNIPGNVGYVDSTFIQGVQTTYKKCASLMAEQFVQTFGNAKTEEQCKQFEKDYAEGQTTVAPPSQAEK